MTTVSNTCLWFVNNVPTGVWTCLNTSGILQYGLAFSLCYDLAHTSDIMAKFLLERPQKFKITLCDGYYQYECHNDSVMLIIWMKWHTIFPWIIAFPRLITPLWPK